MARHHGIDTRIVRATGQSPICLECSDCNAVALVRRSDEPDTFVDAHGGTWIYDALRTHCPRH